MTAPHSALAVSLPPCAEPFRDELLAIERELDSLWPDYERLPFAMPVYGGGMVVLEGYKLKGRPFTSGGLPAEPYRIEHVKRLKWLIKRHSLLMQGLDYGVLVADGAARQAGRCFAHPTSEARPHPEPPPAVARPPFPAALVKAPEQTSAAREAMETGTSLEKVRAAPARPWRP